MNALQFQKKLLSMQDNMMNFALILTSNKNDAEDLLQDTTLKVLDNQDKFVENINFKGWVLTIMRNIFINNYHKVVKNHFFVEQGADVYNLDIENESNFGAPDSFFNMQEIMDAMNGLSEEFKIPFSMHVSGYRYAEISEILKVPLGTIKSRIFFARQELQKELKDFH